MGKDLEFFLSEFSLIISQAKAESERKDWNDRNGLKLNYQKRLRTFYVIMFNMLFFTAKLVLIYKLLQKYPTTYTSQKYFYCLIIFWDIFLGGICAISFCSSLYIRKQNSLHGFIKVTLKTCFHLMLHYLYIESCTRHMFISQ